MTKISILSRSGLAALGAMAFTPAHAAWTLNMPQGVTDLSQEIFDLHMLVFWICVVIGIGVFGAMMISVIMHRKSRGYEAAHFHESTVVEIAWTVVPFIILIGLAIPAAGTLLEVEDSSDPDMTIRVTGYQWLWEYDYVDSDVHFYSRLDGDSDRARQMGSGIDPSSVEHYLRNVDNPMVVPVDKKVRLLLTSGDVIHAWWVPELGGKKDAIPGYINDMWFQANEPGTYRGQCAELCGRDHGFMPIVVKVLPQDEYDAWVEEQSDGGNADAATAQGQQAQGGTQLADASAAQSGAQSDSGSGGSDAAAPAAGEENADGGQSTGGNNDAAAAGGEMSKGDLMAAGEEVYGNICVACHQPDGGGMEAAGFPSLKGSAIIKGPVADQIQQILDGQNAMPPYRDTLSDKQIAAVVTYERNSFGNETGDVVQPATVAEQR